jgi:hypothetical protein
VDSRPVQVVGVLAEDGLVVEEVDRLGALDRDAVDVALVGDGAERGRQEGGQPGRLAQRIDVPGLDVLLQGAAAPGPEDRRRVARSHRELDLLFIGWFSMKSIVMWSPGWLFSKDVTRFWTAVLAGLGPVVTSYMVTVVPLPLALLLVLDAALPLPAADPHSPSFLRNI